MTETIGWIGFACKSAVQFPQIVKTLKTRKVDDISLLTYTLLIAGEICYMIRSWAIGETVWFASNAWSFVSVCFTFYLLLRFRRKNVSTSL